MDRKFFTNEPELVAPKLLGATLVVESSPKLALELVEVEAYGGALDVASHAFRGMTKRNEVMFGPAGFLYVYFTYGMHWCANITCSKEGVPGAVLLRAGMPAEGISTMRRNRNRDDIKDQDIANGPAKLCQALKVDGSWNGLDIFGRTSNIKLVANESTDFEIGQSNRIGVREENPLPWRFFIKDNIFVSKYRG
ncbi:MAG: DNA-3-methyladenine glycosylase [Acidimicrobiales bacterium]|nr:DNA-3-methyladenine glycosylase [Acidimicrobiales bacterium]